MKNIIFTYTGYFCAVYAIFILNSCKNNKPTNDFIIEKVATPVAVGVITSYFTQKPASPAIDSSLISSIANEAKISEIRELIKLVDDVEIQAFRNLNPDLLNRVYTGQALQQSQHKINELKNTNVYMVSALQGQQFHDVKISQDESVAKVEMTEKWSGKLFEIGTNRLLGKFIAQDLPQILYLKKESNQWRVSSISFQGKLPIFVPVEQMQQQGNNNLVPIN